MSTEAGCPACGSPVAFDVPGVIVAVCGSCRSLVGRGDGALEDYGKVAELVPTGSPLDLGVSGRMKGRSFQIVGRTQLEHASGGTWDEWYAYFPHEEKWGWLAEAQGRFYLTFAEELPASWDLESLEVEDQLVIPTVGSLTVSELGRAAVRGAEGELPYRPQPDEMLEYADLTGGGRLFGTIDLDASPPEFFLGREVTLEQLGLAEAAARVSESNRVPAVAVNCSSCAGTLELVAPDQTLRVACPFCGSLHDSREGKLEFIAKQAEGQAKPQIPLGSRGTLLDIEFTTIGFVRRSGTSDGESFTWDEYLLYAHGRPFYWLICSDDHWSIGTEIPAGEVGHEADVLTHESVSYRHYDAYPATVDYVLGQFYWKVAVGDTVRARDYTYPPRMLTHEKSLGAKQTKKQLVAMAREQGVAEQNDEGHWRLPDGGSLGRANKNELLSALGLETSEVHYTLVEHIGHADVAEAFGLESLPMPSGLGPIGPNPLKGFAKITLGVLVAFLVVAGCLSVFLTERKAFDQVFQFEQQTGPELAKYNAWAKSPWPGDKLPAISQRGKDGRVQARPPRVPAYAPRITLGGKQLPILNPGTRKPLSRGARNWLWAYQMAKRGRLDVRDAKTKIPQTLVGSNLEALLEGMFRQPGTPLKAVSPGPKMQLRPYQHPPSRRALEADFVSMPFTVKTQRNHVIYLVAGVSNAWVFTEGRIRNEQTKKTQDFSLLARKVSGFRARRRVQEGGQVRKGSLATLPKGLYRLHFRAERSVAAPDSFRMGITEGGGTESLWELTCCLMSVFGCCGGGLLMWSGILEATR